MSYFLQSIDQFGVQQKLQIPPYKPTQKSALGGFITLILYGASLGYFLYQFVDWQQNNKLPKITIFKEQIQDNQQLKLQGIFTELTYFTSLNNPIDPFNPQSFVLQPQLQILSQNDMQNIPLKLKQETLENGKIITKFIIENIELYNSPANLAERKVINYQLILGYCNPKSLQEGQACAGQDKIDQFYRQSNFFQVTINMQQFNPKTKSLLQVPKLFVFEMRKNQLQINQFFLQVGDLFMDDGFLFPNSHKETFLSDLNVLASVFDQEYSKQQFGEELISILFFNIDQIKTVNMVEYPKISEILADAGSIITWILSISFFVSKYNENLSIEKTQKEIIAMYFNDFMDFQILKNWQGKIKSVKFKGKQYDPQKSEEILNRLDRIAIGKINYMNLQNEVAKLQFILQEHLGQQQIYKYLESKYKLESLFDKIGIPEKNLQQEINQIHAQQEFQQEGIQQEGTQQEGIQQFNLEGEIDSKFNKDILEQEIELRMGLLDIKIFQTGQFKEQNSNLQIQESLQNINNYLTVINVDKTEDKSEDNK